MSIYGNIQIIYEAEDFLAVNKPALLIVHPAFPQKSLQEESLTGWLVQKYPEVRKVGDRPDIRPGIVHRLDRGTSGVLIIARNQKFFNYFKKLLKEGKVGKKYFALVWGKIPEGGEINAPIGLKPNTTRWSTRGKNLKMTKNASTEYKPVKYCRKGNKDFTLTEIYPKTGRTHQIRVHMASINHSVVGDNMYGKKEDPFNLGRQFLHAAFIEFNTREGKRIGIEASLPPDLEEILRNQGCG